MSKCAWLYINSNVKRNVFRKKIFHFIAPLLLGRQLRLSIFAVRIPLCYKSDSIILMYHTIHHDGEIKSAINKCLQKILNRFGVER